MSNVAVPVLSEDDYQSHQASSSGYHICVEVPDMDEALRFYRDVLGLTPIWREHFAGGLLEVLSGVKGAEAEVAQLTCPGGSRLELACYTPQGDRDPRRLNDQGLNHLSFEVKDVQAVHKRLLAAGVRFASAPLVNECEGCAIDGWEVAYFYDPWGTVLELLGPPHARGTE